jgi:hypothetical protein
MVHHRELLKAKSSRVFIEQPEELLLGFSQIALSDKLLKIPRLCHGNHGCGTKAKSGQTDQVEPLTIELAGRGVLGWAGFFQLANHLLMALRRCPVAAALRCGFSTPRSNELAPRPLGVILPFIMHDATPSWT